MAGRTLEVVTTAESRPVRGVAVCGSDELWDGEMACFRVGETGILLVKLGGRFYAYEARCPHQGVALMEGELDGEVLTCRAHQWQFEVTTGQGVNPKGVRLKGFPVHVVAGQVLVEVATAQRRPVNSQQGAV